LSDWRQIDYSERRWKMTASSIFEPSQLGAITVSNRIVMAPMTRGRATFDRVPTALMRDYYCQRATAGLIISEGIIPHPTGRGYLCVPGLYNDAQVEAWRDITTAVHAHGGKIVAQLMHVGRISHSSFLDGGTPLAPSAIAAKGEVFTAEGMKPFTTPVEMTEEQIQATINNFRSAAENASAAGFDGVEIHGASGYLPNQFLAPNANQRSDGWGGPIERRARFLLAVIDETTAAIGSDRVGVRVSPGFGFNDVDDLDLVQTYTYLAGQLSKRSLAYVHVINLTAAFDALNVIRPVYDGNIIANGAYDKARAQSDIDRGRAQFVSFGGLFIANPDLPDRLYRDLPLAAADQATFYTPGPSGYTDYPAYSSVGR
jgi:N-ethylmaleimide reductase